MRQRPGLHHLALLALLGVIVAWIGQRSQMLRQDPAAVLEALRAQEGPWLPEAEAVGAVERALEERYTPATLYDFINGAADAYLGRGFRTCLATTYSFPAASGTPLEVAAEVYRFASADGARAQLEAERPAAAQPLPGATAAWWDESQLVAHSGADYLKLTAYGDGPEVRAALARLLAGWQEGRNKR